MLDLDPKAVNLLRASSSGYEAARNGIRLSIYELFFLSPAELFAANLVMAAKESKTYECTAKGIPKHKLN